MNNYLYDEEVQPDPLLRKTVCPVDVTPMQTNFARLNFFKALSEAKNKKQILESYKAYAESNGCYGNIGDFPEAVENLRKHGMIDEKGRLG